MYENLGEGGWDVKTSVEGSQRFELDGFCFVFSELRSWFRFRAAFVRTAVLTNATSGSFTRLVGGRVVLIVV